MPGSNANSSSRGKKTLPTLGTRSVGSGERHPLPSISLQRPLLLASCEASGQHRWDTPGLPGLTFFPTLGSRWSVPHLGGSVLPVPSFAYALHLRSPHTSRMSMRSPPLFHACQDLDTLLSPGLFVHPWFSSFRCLPDGPILPLLLYLDYSSCKNPWRTRRWVPHSFLQHPPWRLAKRANHWYIVGRVYCGQTIKLRRDPWPTRSTFIDSDRE